MQSYAPVSIHDGLVIEDETRKLRVTFTSDPLPEHPRREDEPIGTLLTSCRYDLGDPNAYTALREALLSLVSDADEETADCPDCQGEGTVECNTCEGFTTIENPHHFPDNITNTLQGLALADPDDEHVFILPVFLFDHSGISISTTPFNDSWDSGQVGIIFMAAETAREHFDDPSQLKLDLNTLRKRAIECLKDEIHALDQFLCGDVFQYEVEEAELCDKGHLHWEHTDSCGGFFGNDLVTNGITDHLGDELTQFVVEKLGVPIETFNKRCEDYRKKLDEKASTL